MSFWKKVKAWLEHKEPETPETTETKPLQPFLARVEFVVREDGEFGINVEWKEDDLEIAHKYAELLFLVGEGLVKQQVALTFVDSLEHNPQSIEFVDYLLTAWHTFIEEHQNKPIVRPSQVTAFQQGEKQ